jgi:hypothetical protein
VTAFLGAYLKGTADLFAPYPNLLEPKSNDSPRTDTSDPRYWAGLPAYAAIGMVLARHVPTPWRAELPASAIKMPW